MTIAFDATALYGRMGGVETLLWQSFAALGALDSPHTFIVWVPADTPLLPADPTGRWQWRRLPFRGAQKARRIAWQQLELPLALRRERADLLHAWNYVAPLACPVPVVLGATDLIALERPRFSTRFNRWHYRAVMPHNLRHAARVVVPSDLVRAQVLRRAPDARVRVVPLGVEPLFLNPSRPHKGRQCASNTTCRRASCCRCNFEPKKNLVGLLAALQQLPDAPPLVVAGGVKPWRRVERQLKGVRRLGFVPRAELPVLFSLCEAFCFRRSLKASGCPSSKLWRVGRPSSRRRRCRCRFGTGGAVSVAALFHRHRARFGLRARAPRTKGAARSGRARLCPRVHLGTQRAASAGCV